MEIKNFFAQDASGNVIPGAQVDVFFPGTTSRVTTLQNAEGGAKANPFFADVKGLIQFAAPNGSYDLKVTTGTTSYTLRTQCADLTESVAEADAAATAAETARDVAVSTYADLQNTTDPALGAAIAGRGVVTATDAAQVSALPVARALSAQLYSGGRSGSFYWSEADHSADVSGDVLQGVYIAPASDLTGASGSWVRQYDIFQGVKIGWFGGVSDYGLTDNSAAIQAAYDFVAGGMRPRTVNWDGKYGFGTTIIKPGSCTTRGNPTDALGSDGPAPSTMAWIGGADPMFYTEGSRTRFFDLGVINKGLATDWIYYAPGAILPVWDNIHFLLPFVENRFSRSVIYSDGHRLGYGKMSRMNAGGSIAPKFIFVDGGETVISNRITTFSITDSVIGASSGLEMTLFYIKNQGIETLNIENNSFNTNSADSNLLIVDTTDTPISDVIFNLNFNGNEIDHIGTDPARRKFKLANVRNVNFNNNEVSAGGQMLHLGDLINSSVTSHDGNSIRSLSGAVWNTDATSKVCPGANRWGVSGTVQPTVSSPSATTGRFIKSENATAATLDFSVYNESGHNVREIDVNVAGAISIRALVAQVTAGTVVTVVHRNVSGGAIAAPSFFPSHFATYGAGVAPANGFSRSYTFYHNGVKFVEVSRTSGDVAN